MEVVARETKIAVQITRAAGSPPIAIIVISRSDSSRRINQFPDGIQMIFGIEINAGIGTGFHLHALVEKPLVHRAA